MSRAVIPGSFDPITLGHMDMIERAAALFDEVIVLLSVNSEKKTMFSAEVRERMLRASCAGLVNVRVDTCFGLLAGYCEDNGVDTLVKGLRNAVDLEYEMPMATVNSELCPGLDTIFVPTKPEFRHISSTIVREMIRYERPLERYMPKEAIAVMRRE